MVYNYNLVTQTSNNYHTDTTTTKRGEGVSRQEEPSGMLPLDGTFGVGRVAQSSITGVRRGMGQLEESRTQKGVKNRWGERGVGDGP